MRWAPTGRIRGRNSCLKEWRDHRILKQQLGQDGTSSVTGRGTEATHELDDSVA